MNRIILFISACLLTLCSYAQNTLTVERMPINRARLIQLPNKESVSIIYYPIDFDLQIVNARLDANGYNLETLIFPHVDHNNAHIDLRKFLALSPQAQENQVAYYKGLYALQLLILNWMMDSLSNLDFSELSPSSSFKYVRRLRSKWVDPYVKSFGTRIDAAELKKYHEKIDEQLLMAFGTQPWEEALKGTMHFKRKEKTLADPLAGKSFPVLKSFILSTRDWKDGRGNTFDFEGETMIENKSDSTISFFAEQNTNPNQNFELILTYEAQPLKASLMNDKEPRISFAFLVDTPSKQHYALYIPIGGKIYHTYCFGSKEKNHKKCLHETLNSEYNFGADRVLKIIRSKGMLYYYLDGRFIGSKAYSYRFHSQAINLDIGPKTKLVIKNLAVNFL